VETYEDFNIRIVADGAGFQVLAQCAAGEANAPFRPPAPRALPMGLQPCQGAARDVRTGAAGNPAAPEEIGCDLFNALFTGSVRRLFDQVSGSVKRNPEQKLRIRLHIDPRDGRLRPLSRLPWELLCCPDADGFLSLKGWSRMVRSLDALQSAATVPLSSPLRILLAMANPPGSGPLRILEEREALEHALRRTGSVELSVLERTTSKALLHRLRDEDFSIVHFAGHGLFDDVAGEGALLLESSSGQADAVSGEVLATLLRQRSGPALVVLNACKTARSGEQEDAAPFTGVAAALVGSGIPAVLAMQTSIADRAAVTLTEELYERLAAGDSIEEAVAAARLALYMSSPRSGDWAIPVLFLRSASTAPLEGLGLYDPAVKETAVKPDIGAATVSLTTYRSGTIGTQINNHSQGNTTINLKGD
jgi:hypothetical protein